MADHVKGPLFDALVRNAAAREDVAAEAQARARKASHDTTARVVAASTAAEAVDVVMRAALLAAAPGVRKGAKLVAAELATETHALKRQDPRTVPALRDADVAAARAAKITGEEVGNGQGTLKR